MSRARLAIVAGLYTVLTLVMMYPISVNPSGLKLGGGADPSLYIWTIGWGTHALTHAPWAAFDANIFFPFKHTLAFSENALGSAALAIPVMWLTGDPLTSTNVVAIVAVMLCAFGGYYLGRTLGLSPAAAFMTGLIFAFAPPRFARLAQIHLAVHWVPFCLAFLHRYLNDGRPRHLHAALALFSLQALTSGHGAALLILGSALIIGFRLAGGMPLAVVTRVRDVGVTGLLVLVPAPLMFIPYWFARREVGLERVLDDVGVTWSSYLSSPSHVHKWMMASLPDWVWLRQEPDAFLFPGFVPLVLAALALSRLVPRERWTYLAMIVITAWMTIGPPFSIWRWVYWLPGLNFIRVPSRFTLLGILALAVLAGFGFDRVSKSWPQTRRRFAAAGIATLLLIECAFMPIDARPFKIDSTAVDHWLNTQPKPFSVAEFPLSESRADSRRADMATNFMLHSLAHHQPTVFGYSGVEPPGYKDMYNDLIRFPSDQSITRLTNLGVTYAVVHLEYYAAEFRAEYEARLTSFGDRLRLVHQDGLGRVYRLQTKSQ